MLLFEQFCPESCVLSLLLTLITCTSAACRLYIKKYCKKADTLQGCLQFSLSSRRSHDPSTVYSCQLSFSVLKRVKTFLNGSLSAAVLRPRLNGMTVVGSETLQCTCT